MVNVSEETMSDLAWAVKNGDMDQVKELVDVKVGATQCGGTENANFTESFQSRFFNQHGIPISKLLKKLDLDIGIIFRQFFIFLLNVTTKS